eukprot:2227465-Rhodomonas_salina.1
MVVQLPQAEHSVGNESVNDCEPGRGTCCAKVQWVNCIAHSSKTDQHGGCCLNTNCRARQLAGAVAGMQAVDPIAVPPGIQPDWGDSNPDLVHRLGCSVHLGFRV